MAVCGGCYRIIWELENMYMYIFNCPADDIFFFVLKVLGISKGSPLDISLIGFPVYIYNMT